MKKKIWSLLFLFMALILQAKTSPVVTVFPFLYNGLAANGLSQAVSDSFQNYLYQTGAFDIVEQSQINSVIKQQGFQSSGLTNDSDAISVGEILNAQYIIVGTVSKLQTIYSVNARLINIETGKIEKSEQIMAADESSLLSNMQILAVKIAGVNINRTSGYIEGQASEGAAKGLLYIKCNEAELYLTITNMTGNLIFEGTTPASLEITFGNYNIKAIDKKKLYKDYESTIIVDTEKKINIQIKPDPSFYTLEVLGKNGDLFIDGVGMGSIPTTVRVSQAEHTVRVIPHSSNYENFEQKLPLTSDTKTKTLSVTFIPISIKLLIATTPANEFNFFLDNKYMGTTPDKFMIPCGIHLFRFEGTITDPYLNVSKEVVKEFEIEILPEHQKKGKLEFNMETASTIGGSSSSGNSGNYGGANIEGSSGDYGFSQISTGEKDDTRKGSNIYFDVAFKIITEFEQNKNRLGIDFGLGYQYQLMKNNFGIGLAMGVVLNALDDSSSSRSSGNDSTKIACGLDFSYRYKLFDLLSLGAIWTPAIVIEKFGTSEFGSPSPSSAVLFENEIGAIIGIEYSYFGFYYKIGANFSSGNSTTRTNIINELGLSISIPVN